LKKKQNALPCLCAFFFAIARSHKTPTRFFIDGGRGSARREGVQAFKLLTSQVFYMSDSPGAPPSECIGLGNLVAECFS